jgi:hypothetical protein
MGLRSLETTSRSLSTHAPDIGLDERELKLDRGEIFINSSASSATGRSSDVVRWLYTSAFVEGMFPGAGLRPPNGCRGLVEARK